MVIQIGPGRPRQALFPGRAPFQQLISSRVFAVSASSVQFLGFMSVEQKRPTRSAVAGPWTILCSSTTRQAFPSRLTLARRRGTMQSLRAARTIRAVAAGLAATAPMGNTPLGLRIARYDFPTSQVTFSLLQQFLAAGTAGTSRSIERSEAAVAADGSLAAAVRRVRRVRHGDPLVCPRMDPAPRRLCSRSFRERYRAVAGSVCRDPDRDRRIPESYRDQEHAGRAPAGLRRLHRGAALAGRIPSDPRRRRNASRPTNTGWPMSLAPSYS